MSKVYFDLASGPFQQNWNNTGQVTADNNWSGVPSIEGFQGQNVVTTTGANAGTAVTDSTLPGDLFVIANQLNPTSVFTGGVAEFELADPTIALQGSGVADAPHIIIYLDASGRENITFSFNARDIDGSGDNAVQQIAVQYRIGETGPWTNLPPGGQSAGTPQIADATTGPNAATLVTPITVVLPSAANNQSQLQIRVLTTNAVDNDEWVGIDDIVVNSVQSSPVNTVPGPQTVNEDTTLAISGVSVADASNTSGFQISLTVANGALAVATGGGASISGNGTDTVTLAGTLAQVNAALAGLQYRGDLNFNGPDTLTIVTDDGAGGTDTDSIDINVAPRNDLPVLDLDANDSSGANGANYTATFTEGGPFVSITDTDVSIIDPDATFLLSATITLTNRVAADFLSVNGPLPAGITTSGYNPATGLLTLSAAPGTSLADFQTALRAIEFSTGSVNSDATDRIVSIVVSDGQGNSNTANTFIHIVPVDTAPTLDLDADDSSGATGQDFTATFTQGGAAVAIADSDAAIVDPDNTTIASATIRLTNAEATDLLSVNGALPGGITASAYDPLTGTLTLTGAATIADYQAALRQIEYSSSSASPRTATRLIEVVVSDGTEDGAVATSRIQVIDNPPALDLDGDDSSAAGTDYLATFTEGGAAAPISDLDVVILNTAQVSSATITLTNPLTGDLLSINGALPNGITASAYDPVTGVLTLTGAAAPADYQTALRQITFSNDSDDPATIDRVIEVVLDGSSGVSNVATAIINVGAVNDAPALTVAPAASYAENAPPLTLSPASAIVDLDSANLVLAVVAISAGAVAGDTLTVNGTTSGQVGNVTFEWLPGLQQMVLSGPGSAAEYQSLLRSVQYASTSDDPTNAGNDPTRTITWTVFDGATPMTETTALTVAALNDGPSDIEVAQGATLSIGELGVGGSANGTVVGTVVAQDPDDNTGLTYSLANNAGGRFAINATTGQITVARAVLLDFEQAQSHTITVRASDSGGLSIDRVFTINVTDLEPENATADNSNNTLFATEGGDVLRGAGGNDTLSTGGGRDYLYGDAGDDIMRGGADDDSYYVDSTRDQIIDAGNDTEFVVSSASFTLPDAVEHILLTGTANINATGNDLRNTITGNAGINVLTGKGGDDSYVVQNTTDRVVELAGGGTDHVTSSASFTLGANVERLILSGNAAINATGNSENNRITGNGASNILTGGNGDDIFVFNTALNAATNVDTITDFSALHDTLYLENAIFTGLANGFLTAGAFNTGTAATEADDRIIYNSATGALIFDSNGRAAGGATQFATLAAGLDLTNADFFVV